MPANSRWDLIRRLRVNTITLYFTRDSIDIKISISIPTFPMLLDQFCDN